MKITRLTIPFALFMLMGSNAIASNSISNEALQAITNVIKSAQQQYPAQNQQASTSNTNIKLPNQCPNIYPLGAPIVMSVEKDRIERRSFYLCRIGYSVQFDPATKTPLWSAERLKASELSGKKEARTDDFQPDPNVPAPAQAKLTDYSRSGFDRGHMAPAANQTGKGNESMSETFYLTNMVPQVGQNHNRGIWADLEAQVRTWATQRGELLVVSGPIYEGNVSTIGSSKVMVPTSVYKVVLDPVKMESIAFIIPNRQIVTRKTNQLDKGNTNQPQTLPEYAINCNPNRCSIGDFAVPIKNVEQLTGLRFFTSLKPDVHVKVTSTISPSWSMR